MQLKQAYICAGPEEPYYTGTERDGIVRTATGPVGKNWRTVDQYRNEPNQIIRQTALLQHSLISGRNAYDYYDVEKALSSQIFRGEKHYPYAYTADNNANVARNISAGTGLLTRKGAQ